MGLQLRSWMSAVILGISLTGCAVNVPSMGYRNETPQARQLREADLVNHIKCELQLALQRIFDQESANQNGGTSNSLEWLKGWGAKVSLQLEVNVKSTASPNITVSTPLQNFVTVFPENGNVTTSRNRSAAFGATFGSEITRTETMGFFYKFEDLENVGRLGPKDPDGNPVTPKDASFCGEIDIVMDDDLQIYDFLQSKIILAARPDALLPTANGSPFEVLSYQLKFIVTEGSTINPSWKLAGVTIGPSGTLYNGQKVRTNNLTITLGPVETADGLTEPSQSLSDQHLSELIGRAISDAIRNQQ